MEECIAIGKVLERSSFVMAIESNNQSVNFYDLEEEHNLLNFEVGETVKITYRLHKLSNGNNSNRISYIHR